MSEQSAHDILSSLGYGTDTDAATRFGTSIIQAAQVLRLGRRKALRELHEGKDNAR